MNLLNTSRVLLAVCAAGAPWFATTAAAQMVTPPVAVQKPHAVASPSGTRNDNYYWLRDDERKAPDVLAYVNSENQWYAQHAKRYKAMEDGLFEEIKGRIKQDDASVPTRKGDYLYYTRFEQGREYPLYARKRNSPEAAEEILLDVNQLAQGKGYYQIGAYEVSAGQDIVAYLEDVTGRQQFTLRFKNMGTGEVYADSIPGLSSTIAWANDNKTIFYVENDANTLRSYKVKRHVLGSSVASDVTVYEEKDDSFYTEVKKTSSQAYIQIHVSSTISDEVFVLDAATPTASFKSLASKRADFHYQADHIADRWIIRTDWQAPNYRLMQVAQSGIGQRSQWKPLLAHDAKVFINKFELFANYLVIDERSEGLRRLRVQPWAQGKMTGKAQYIRSDESAYSTMLLPNFVQGSEVMRYVYSSLTTPHSIYDYNLRTGERTLLKRQPVLGGFDSANYQTERTWVTVRDGTRVPVSLVYRKGFQKDGTAPLFQFAYGSYGMSIDPMFRSSIVSLLDRGFVYAIAHIRGGQEMGRAWYEDGKKLKKKNTFNDFVDVTEALVQQKYAAKDKVFAQGGSAGGLLMGAVANMRPDLYRGILAAVPFVDVVTTMLDESIPLTTNEFEEWGNPKHKKFYDYMLSYSPYDNVKAQVYPAMLVTTGLHDSQVQYYEPAKWVAKLRTLNQGKAPLLMRTNMEAGHGGSAGRFKQLRETAQDYAFVLDQLGITQ
ncbi:S9 family peptidase [Rhodoferax sp. AJA081-3]|uniref:S9 family peptidase n=1 Tax=Rhodoferax sp. AJA081-3 TaxID=2752316 RepID=UPI001ADFB48E|nr:S9 family peptidase [Rhodoferax sp. AJA081-3]QTN27843.1 S9 family peptidase [Rhodoferax sp. AJA081-3]